MAWNMAVPTKRKMLGLVSTLLILQCISGASRPFGYRPYSSGSAPRRSPDDGGDWSDDYSDYSDLSDAAYSDHEEEVYSDYESKQPRRDMFDDDEFELDLGDNGYDDRYDMSEHDEYSDFESQAQRRPKVQEELFGSDDESPVSLTSKSASDKGALYDAYNELHSLAQVSRQAS